VGFANLDEKSLRVNVYENNKLVLSKIVPDSLGLFNKAFLSSAPQIKKFDAGCEVEEVTRITLPDGSDSVIIVKSLGNPRNPKTGCPSTNKRESLWEKFTDWLDGIKRDLRDFFSGGGGGGGGFSPYNPPTDSPIYGIDFWSFFGSGYFNTGPGGGFGVGIGGGGGGGGTSPIGPGTPWVPFPIPPGMVGVTTSPGDYLYNKTNFDEETGDLDSKFLNGNYYNLNYTSYSSPDKFPTISPIIPQSKFVGWDQGLHPNWKCMDFAKEQLRVMGYTLSEYYAPNQTIQINTEAAGPNDKLTKEAVGYLLSALKENIPVIVGVDNKAGSPNDATDKTTDHFIVIVGAGNENGIPFFLFYDNATNGPTGVSNNNRLYYLETLGTISGRSDVPHVNDPAYGRRFYTVTQIRKSKKN